MTHSAFMSRPFGRGLLASVLLASLLVTGCATNLGGGAYERTEARRTMTVRMGVVEAVRNVTLEGSNSGGGGLAGAAVGGIAGSNVGGGKGAAIGAILGVVAGSIAGTAIENQATRKPGVEVTVKLDSGDMLAVVQEADEVFKVGDRVRLLSHAGTTRVSH